MVLIPETEAERQQLEQLARDQLNTASTKASFTPDGTFIQVQYIQVIVVVNDGFDRLLEEAISTQP